MMLGIQAPLILVLYHPLGAALIIMMHRSLWLHQHSCQQEGRQIKQAGENPPFLFKDTTQKLHTSFLVAPTGQSLVIASLSCTGGDGKYGLYFG